MKNPSCRRSASLVIAAWVVAGCTLSGCATRSPAVQLHRLPSQPPIEGAAAAASAADPQARGAWQLMLPVKLPDYLDRDTLLVPQGASGLRPLPAQRWAEPLRDAVQRLLLADLAQLRGASPVVAAPLPPGLMPTRQLRVELQSFEATADLGAVRLQARWSLADPAGTTPPALHQVSIDAPSAGPDADALVAAHRLALWRLAQRIAAGG